MAAPRRGAARGCDNNEIAPHTPPSHAHQGACPALPLGNPSWPSAKPMRTSTEMPIDKLITATVIGRSQLRSNALLQAAWITIREPAATATGIKNQLILRSSPDSLLRFTLTWTIQIFTGRPGNP